MTQQTINIGTTPNDGTGETLPSAFDKINDNFTELYTELGGTSLSNISFSENSIISDNTNGDINFDPNGIGNVVVSSGDILPASDSTIQSIGTTSDPWTNLHVGEGNIDIIHISQLIIAPNLPTSSTGLPVGTLWNNSGIVNIA